MFQVFRNAWKDPALRKKILFTLLIIVIFRFGAAIFVPFLEPSTIKQMMGEGTILNYLDVMTGGSLSNGTLFAMSITPYINASIIVQLLTVAIPALERLSKEGEEGRKKINKITKYVALGIGLFQAIAFYIGLRNTVNETTHKSAVLYTEGFDGVIAAITIVACFVAGASLIIWLGDQISQKGIGNGISIIIFAGIVAGLPPAIAHTIEQARQGDLHFLVLLLVAVLVFAVTFFVVFVERGQRRIVVNYAKRQQGRRVYAAQSTHLPLKVNMAGVIPAIFASSIILFPATIASWFGGGTGWNWLTTISLYLQPGQPLYVLLYASAIIFFCFFYTALVFNPRETADNLKKSGAFVPGIRPGEQTAKYIDKVMTRLTLVGALYITFICLIPEFMRDAMKVPFYFGGTSLLIVVVVIMDFMAQVQTLMMSSQYESALKKANLKGYGR